MLGQRRVSTMKHTPNTPPGVRFIAIAAMAQNRVIGNGNAMPWHVPEDFRWFKSQTLGKTLLMGRKTFESLGKPLPKRRTIVISRSDYQAEGITVIHSLEELGSVLTEPECWICGGAEIYAMTLPWWHDLYLSLIEGEYPGDAFFPPFEDQLTGGDIVHRAQGVEVRHYLGRG